MSRSSRLKPPNEVDCFLLAVGFIKGKEMPFNRFFPYAFSLVSVQRNAPAMSGVYGLSNAREWLFIGETDNIKASLVRHLQGTHTPLLEREPTGFTFELCSPHDRQGRKSQLIEEYEPFFG